MDFNIWFWVWLALAVMLSIGVGAAVAAALEYFVPGSIGWQWAAFIGVSSILLILLRRIANTLTHEPPMRVAGDRLLGKCGVVIERLEVGLGSGRVRVEREEWRADAPGFEPMEI